MTDKANLITQDMLNALLPPERSDAFFDALYGDAEDGAYTIKLVLREVSQDGVKLAFELHQRPEKCLVCSLTYGLPQVFQRHPLINTQGMAQEIATTLGWDASAITWELGRTEEHGAALHSIPFTIKNNTL